MKTLKSFSDLARVLEKNMKQMQVGLTEAMKTSAIAVVAEAKDEIGEYQRDDMGGFPAWTELSDATKVERVRLGYAADEESQKMRGFFEHGNQWTLDKLQEKFTAAPTANLKQRTAGATGSQERLTHE